MPRPILLLALAVTLACGTARADCALLNAPPEMRARLLAFHYANELRQAREPARRDAVDPDAGPPRPARAAPDRGAPTDAPRAR